MSLMEWEEFGSKKELHDSVEYAMEDSVPKENLYQVKAKYVKTKKLAHAQLFVNDKNFED